MKKYIIGFGLGIFFFLISMFVININLHRGPDKPLNFKMKSEYVCHLEPLKSPPNEKIVESSKLHIFEFDRTFASVPLKRRVISLYIKKLLIQKEEAFFAKLMKDIGAYDAIFYSFGKFQNYLVESRIGESHAICCEKLYRSFFDSSDNNDFCGDSKRGSKIYAKSLHE